MNGQANVNGQTNSQANDQRNSRNPEEPQRVPVLPDPTQGITTQGVAAQGIAAQGIAAGQADRASQAAPAHASASPARSPMGVIGIETEYAVSDLADPHANPIELSHEVIAAAGQGAAAAIRWDYGMEDPVNDARGMRLQRAQADPSMLTDSPQLRATNRLQTNGARIYVDHAHPEYSAPECIGPFEALLYDRAGDELMRAAARAASARSGRRIVLHRNNTDGKGASWGAHENYLVPRAVPFDLLARLFATHAVTRQIFTGAGRVGLGEKSEEGGFQMSQRADFFHARIGLQTTFDRPIVNTRDESHATERFRRFHVIAGDANRMDVPEALKLGTTAVVLWLAGALDAAGFDPVEVLSHLELADPVDAMHTVSHDLTLRTPLLMADGTRRTAWQVQVALRSQVYATAAQIWGCSSVGEPLWPDDSTARIMRMWGQALADVAHVMNASDDERLGLSAEAGRLEWLLKWQIAQSLRARRSLPWTDARLRAIDIAWAALEPKGCVFESVRGRAEALVEPDAVHDATSQPPRDTRAWLRGTLVSRCPQAVYSAGWSRITVQDAGFGTGDDGAAAEAGAGAGTGAGTGAAGAGAGATDGASTGDGAAVRIIDCSDPCAHTEQQSREAVEAFLGGISRSANA